MDNINKTSADRILSAEDTATGMSVQGPAVAVAAKAFIFEGEPPRKLTIEELIEVLAGRLGSANEHYRVADATHQAETSGDVDARKTRDAAIDTLRASVIAAGHAVTGAFGPPMRTSMGLDVTWALRGDLLVGQVRNAIQLITKTRKLHPIAAGLKVDAVTLADSLEAQCAELDAALEGVKREERAAQATFQDRELAAQEWERAYPGIAEIFRGFCILAGRHELAARVKPTARKARSRGSKESTSATTPNGSVTAATPETSSGNVDAPTAPHTDIVTH